MMRIIPVVLIISMLILLTACGSKNTTDSSSLVESLSENTSQSTTTLSSTTQSLAEENLTTKSSTVDSSNETKSTKIKLTVNDKTAAVKLLDTDATKDFISMLPLTLTFDDYNNTEKIATLPRNIIMGSAPRNCDPDIGTFAYYAPWGNLCVFYKDFRESDNLIPLGTFENGIEIFADMEDGTTVTIELEGN